MKRNRSLALCACLLLCFALASCASCGKTQPPELESIKDELIEKIEASAEINEIFWGDGLPVVEIGSYEAMDRDLYNDQNDIKIDDDGFWEYVHPEKSKYHSIYEIKLLAESVYSVSFLSAVYESQFEGVENAAYIGKGDPHYKEESYMLWKNTGLLEDFKLIDGKRTFNFDTMELGKKSSAERLYITVDSQKEGNTEIEEITLIFDLQDGEYFLSSPTY